MEASELLNRLKVLPDQTRATASLKAGLRNIINEGHGSPNTMPAAREYLTKHEQAYVPEKR